MPAVGERAVEQPAFPLELFRCEDCGLAQIGLEVSPEVLFPYSYPYLSGTTRILRDNFADLYRESSPNLGLPTPAFLTHIASTAHPLLTPLNAAHHTPL